MEHKPLIRPQMFYATAAVPCPYIKDRFERKIVTELTGPDADGLHEKLARSGFRRSHSIAYAPACKNCRQCVAARVVVADFQPRRSQKRTMKANGDLVAKRVPAIATTEQYSLFAAYQNSRHHGSDMAGMGFYEYCAMVEDSPINTYLVEFRSAAGELVAVVLVDRTSDGVSAVYSFFQTRGTRRGLGTFIILWLIEHARQEGLPYVYLGYWIRDSGKMEYKTRFTPLELLLDGRWQRFDRDEIDRLHQPDFLF